MFPGAVHHVIARGNERGPVFHDSSDCAEFLETRAAAAADGYRVDS